jgi:Holliday junction DNA helicase RuvA
MIAYLHGSVLEKSIDRVVIEVNGVGYEVLVIPEDYNQLALKQEARIYIYEHIRESAYDLYGFIQPASRQFFQQLLSVSGVGPKVALAVLGIGSIQTIKQAVAGGDIKLVQSAPGVGRRVAERLIVELKDKVGLASGSTADFLQTGQIEDEATQALVALGYQPTDAARTLAGIDTKLSTEDRVKLALKKGTA